MKLSTSRPATTPQKGAKKGAAVEEVDPNAPVINPYIGHGEYHFGDQLVYVGDWELVPKVEQPEEKKEETKGKPAQKEEKKAPKKEDAPVEIERVVLSLPFKFFKIKKKKLKNIYLAQAAWQGHHERGRECVPRGVVS